MCKFIPDRSAIVNNDTVGGGDLLGGLVKCADPRVDVMTGLCYRLEVWWSRNDTDSPLE